MRPIGFSTGALALGAFRDGLAMVDRARLKAVELSALRDHELQPLMAALPQLNLSAFGYVSVHVPSKLRTLTETQVVEQLRPCMDLGLPIVLHPDAIVAASNWKSFGRLLCIENMDKRKPTGQTVDDLSALFDVLPDASFCLDIAHAHQVDSTMTQARQMLRRFGSRLRQVHISEIDSNGKHHGMSLVTILAAQKVASLIDADVPIIIESQVPEHAILRELQMVERALTAPTPDFTDGEQPDWGELA